VLGGLGIKRDLPDSSRVRRNVRRICLGADLLAGQEEKEMTKLKMPCATASRDGSMTLISGGISAAGFIVETSLNRGDLADEDRSNCAIV
jgi:hypothetical protein